VPGLRFRERLVQVGSSPRAPRPRDRTACIIQARAGAVLLLVAVLLFAGALPARADRGTPAAEERILEVLPLDDLAPRERDRVVDAIRQLTRIHRAAGDPSGGEIEAYMETVEDLARYLKRETVEERRELLREARVKLQDVDREWIARAFERASQGTLSESSENVAAWEEQAAALRVVGDLLAEEREIVVRQKALGASAERRYREILRLDQEGRRLLESIGRPAIQSALEWMVADLDHAFEESVRPAHDRQVHLLALYKRAATDLGSGSAASVVKEYREWASKLRAIGRHLGRRGPGDSG